MASGSKIFKKDSKYINDKTILKSNLNTVL